jgi:hypothetical protein
MCSRAACPRPAAATFTYDYEGATIAVGPLSLDSERYGHDLCAFHTARLGAPVGWRILRYTPPDDEAEDVAADPAAGEDGSRQAVPHEGLTQ